MNQKYPSSPPHLAALSIGIAFALSMPAATGQETADDATSTATTLDRVQVTGTRIRQVELETEQPVLVISRDEIEKQGFQSVADVLNNLTATGTPAITRAQPLLSGEAIGGQFISMRNLGATRTLVLVNGRRLGITTSGLQDISFIPAVMIERIEVLKDSASSLYGSDAIGGVVNLITRSGFEGAEAGVYHGQYSQGDGAITRVDGAMGVRGERGSIVIAAEYAEEDEVFARDRPFSAFPQSDRHPDRGWTTVSQWGVINLPGALGGNRVLRQGADWRDIANYEALNTDVGAPTGATGGAGSTIHKSNPNAQTHLRTPQERRSLFIDAIWELGDAMRLRANLGYGERDAEFEVAGYPLQSAAFPNVPPLSVDSYYNPVGSWHGFENPQAVNFWRRTWEQPRVDTPTTTNFRFATALEGSFDVGARYFDWEAGYLFNRNRINSGNFGNLNLTSIARAVGPSFLNANGIVQCGTPDNPIPYGSGQGECVPWNPFIPFGREGDGGLTGNQDLQDFLFQELHATGETTTTIFNANVSGLLATLPAGDLGFAVGVEHRKEEGKFTPDALAVSGESSFLASRPTAGQYSVDEIYLELAVPILADVPGARDLSLSLSTRYSDYDTFGDTTNSKLGLQWRPTESVLLRGTWAQGFRAPTIANLYGGGSQTFDFFTDPCDTQFGASATSSAVRARCAADIADADNFRQLAQGFNPAPNPGSQTPVAFFNGSNADQLPEESKSYTAGLVWSPGFANGLNFGLDWWKIRIDNTIVADTATQILNDCYVQGDASRCAGFTRDPSQGFVSTLNRGPINAGYQEIEGYDLDVRYTFDAGELGTFMLNWQNTYTARNELKTDKEPDTSPQQLVSFGGNFRLRSNLNLSWQRGDFGASWGARYFSAMKDSCLQPALFPEECSNPDYTAPNPVVTGGYHRLGSNTFHDVEFRWNVPWSATVAFGANNVFNHFGPPMYNSNLRNSTTPYQGVFDIGRFVYMKYQQRF